MLSESGVLGARLRAAQSRALVLAPPHCEGDPAAAPPEPRPTSEHEPTLVDVRVTVARPRWEGRYARVAAGSDTVALTASVVLHGWWGATPPYPRPLLGMATVLTALLALAVARAWEPGVLGQGPVEFNRLLRALAAVGVAVALGGLALQEPFVRPYSLGVVPVAFAAAAGGRLVLRWRLRGLRARGRCMHNVLAVGGEESVVDIIRRTRRSPSCGWNVTGACLPSGQAVGGSPAVLGVPVIGDLDSVADVVCRFGYHTVSVAPAPGWSSRRLQLLAWDLEGTGTGIVVDPGLMAIAGPRLLVDAVDGSPMLRLTEPAFRGLPRVIKTTSDYVGAAVLLLVLAPVMAAIALAVRRDGGPVLYRQTRVGKAGTTFTMLKFRSMSVDADRGRQELAARNIGAGPLFKVPDDPRITMTGRFLRRHSMDELPQLLNVLAGSMSLIGPRPPLPAEAASFDRDARRRLCVKPGMTGLWQVSGRSDLAWDESVRLDIGYVENWSLVLDAVIIAKTVGAVVRGSGAY